MSSTHSKKKKNVWLTYHPSAVDQEEGVVLLSQTDDCTNTLTFA